MNYKNVFRKYLNFENCMTNRVSFATLKKEIFIENINEMVDMPVWIFPLHK